MEYLDFEIEIGQGQGHEYPVAVSRSPAGEARYTMHFPFDTLALQNRLQTLQIALLRSGGNRRQALSDEEQTVQDFGKQLFDALVGGEVRSRFDVSLQQARQQDKGLRIKLRIQSPELATLPWEFLYDDRQGEYLCLSRNTQSIRYLELPQPIPRLTITPPLRILAMTASPADLPPLDVLRERQRIETAVKDLQNKGFLELTWLAGQTWRDLQKAMWAGPWHAFHFIGHGGFDCHKDEGVIALADEHGRRHLLWATQLATLLADHFSLRLVVLNSCDGAKSGELDIYSGTAAILVRRGIAALLAMQYEITDSAAIEFSRSFYEALSYGMPIDAAVGNARIAINIAVNNSLEWGIPVLFMRSPDGVLFDLPEISSSTPLQLAPASGEVSGFGPLPPPEAPKPVLHEPEPPERKPQGTESLIGSSLRPEDTTKKNRFLSWLGNSTNLKAAIFVTGLVASLITGIWMLYLYYRPTLLVTVEKGDLVYAGMNKENIWGWSCPEGTRCSDKLYQMSLLDIGINNPSKRDLMITEVTLIPEWIWGCFWAGEIPPSKTYGVNLDEWYRFSTVARLELLSDAETEEMYPGFDRKRLIQQGRIKRFKMATQGGWESKPIWSRPDEIKITEIPGHKYTIKANSQERFQLKLYLTGSHCYLYGTVYVYIRTDDGTLLKSERLPIFIASPLVPKGD